KDVRMALVSGRPISFEMNLYDPLFVKRPTVELELFASLRPPTYSGDLAQRKLDAMPQAAMAPKPTAGFGGGAVPAHPEGKARAADGRYANALRYREEVKRSLNERMDLGQGVQSAATAAKLGDFFQYLIDKPVTLPRQKSALLPIANKDVEGARVSIY